MKKSIGLLVLTLSSLLLSNCYYHDDDYWNINLEIRDAIKLENKENYMVGDTLFFELNFSRYLPEEGYSNLLDIYETSGANEFRYDFNLLKYSAFSESYQGLWWNMKYLLAEKGGAEGSDYASHVFTVLNKETDVYESRIGLILVEEGEFQIDFDYLWLNGYSYDNNKPGVYIEHIISEDKPLQLNFTVSN